METAKAAHYEWPEKYDHEWYEYLDGLEGGPLDGVRVLDDPGGRGGVAFVSRGVAYPVALDGDCCSETWVADVIGTGAIGGTVLGVDVVEMGEVSDHSRTRQEYDKAYSIKIRTDRGQLEVIFRNSSNGYYGAECAPWPEVDVDGWINVTEDVSF